MISYIVERNWVTNDEALISGSWVDEGGDMKFCKVTDVNLMYESSVRVLSRLSNLLMLTYPGNIVGGTIPLSFFALFMMV